MAHGEERPTAIEGVLELLSEHGRGRMAEAMQTSLNEAMKLERSEFLRASPGERTDERTGYANGFKDKAMRTRVGELALRVPQARPLPGGEPLGFYPKSLERGLLSDPEGDAAEAFAVAGLGGLFAKRWTFYVDRDGVVREIDTAVSTEAAGQDIARRLGELGFPKKP